MKRALLISAHFPPDSTAGTHRVRLLAPHLAQHGWEPTVLTVDASAYEGRVDPELLSMVPPTLRVIRAAAWPPTLTRRIGIGDLGLRSLRGLYRAACSLLERERHDLLFITIFPAYTALLGPALSRRFNIPFVLDYQDPWVSAWGKAVGGGVLGAVDLKSRLSRMLAERLEPRVVRAAAAITAVSEGTFAPILHRNPAIRPITAELPIGVEPADFTKASATAEFPPDGNVHVLYAGALLPLGVETVRAFLDAVRLLRDSRPELYRRLRLHFVGTSNQVTPTDVLRVVPIAKDLGVSEVVAEVPTRVPYTRALRMQSQATALLALGSSEVHYTASKIYPMLLARRPMLAIYHERSTVVTALQRVVKSPSVHLVTYSDDARAASKVEAIVARLTQLIETPTWSASDVNMTAMSEYFAENVAARLADVFYRALAGERAGRAA